MTANRAIVAAAAAALAAARGLADPPAPVPAEPAPVVPAPAGRATPAAEQAPAKAGEMLFLPPPQDPPKFRLDASWDNGLWFESADKQFRVHVGGVGQVDANWPVAPHGVYALPGGGTNGVENSSAIFLRRARFRMDGSIFDQFDYMVEYDLANANNENDGLQPPSFGNLTGAPNPCNLWMQVRDVPYLGDVRAGNQVKPIGLTNNTSMAFLPFIERADNMDAFYGPFDGGFALGVSARDRTESERVTWQYGVYGPSINVFGVSLNKAVYGGRVTALPVYEGDGERLVHVGFGTLNGELVQNQLRVRARPVLRNGPGYAVPVLVDTTNIPGSRQYTLAPEFAAVYGPFTVQAEWAGQFLTRATPDGGPSVGTVFYHGGYVEALYFLTGEHQEYDKRDGAFGRVVPRNNYHVKPGDACQTCGAWQIGVRFSYLDLNDKSIQGGQIYDWTVGLNWFLNPNMKVQFNYILERRDAPQDVVHGWINGFGIQTAYDF
ncbi:MAG TPA: porin [Gemmataceae bacterium]